MPKRRNLKPRQTNRTSSEQDTSTAITKQPLPSTPSRSSKGEPPTPSSMYLVNRRQVSFHSGPIPPPDDLARYNDIIPNGADRILAMAEKQSDHRMHIEKLAIGSEIRRAYLGLWLGFVVTLAVLVSSLILIETGHGTEGLALIGIDIVALAGLFVYGSNNRKNERIQKAKIMTNQEKASKEDR